MKEKLRKSKRKMAVVIEAGVPIRDLGRGKKPYQVDFARGLQRERKCFALLDDAKAHAARLAGKVVKEGLDALSITPEQRADAKRAMDLLRGRATLTDAARAYLKLNPDHGAKRVWRAMGEYLRYMRREQRRPLSIREKRQKFAKMFPALGRRPVEAVMDADLEAWADAQGYTGTNRRNYLRAGRNLLNFAQGKLKAKQSATRAEVKVWSRAEVETWLRCAEVETPEAMPVWVLMFFAGLRPHEAAKITWDAVNLAHRHVRVDAAISKVGEARLVTLSDNALAWLATYRPHIARGPMVRGKDPVGVVRNWREKIKTKLSLTDYPVDVARHTFATAHYEAHGDAGATAKQLGHFGGLDIFRKHYKGLMPHEDALTYWKIMPRSTGNVIQLSRASA